VAEAAKTDMDIEVPAPGTRSRRELSEGTVRLMIRRQDAPDADPYWQAFEVPRYPNMNVVECLMEIRKNPVDAEGRKTTPVAWAANCLEEVCGICTMRVNGRVRQSCAALIRDLDEPIRLEPMEKFPVKRDLVINRNRLFADYRRVHAWIPLDGTHDLGPGPRLPEDEREEGYWLSRCISCGCCVDACPQVVADREDVFIGAAPITWARLMNIHPTGAINAEERYEGLIGPGGIADCAKAGNCTVVCPKEIDNLGSIAAMNRQITRHLLTEWLRE